MANIVLGITGSVAAIHTPLLFEHLRSLGDVKIVATRASLYFFDPAGLPVIRDEDEWPGTRYQRGDSVLHIELRRWANLLLIAPLDANTLAKLAFGMCDNTLSCMVRAWERDRPIVVAPAMNTLMWTHPATARHLAQLREDQPRLHLVEPIEKRLACDDVGVGGQADRDEIVRVVGEVLGGRQAL